MVIQSDMSELRAAMEYIENSLSSSKVKQKRKSISMLLAEELITKFISSDESDKITVNVTKLFGDINIRISSRGEKIDLYGFLESSVLTSGRVKPDEQFVDIVRGAILNAFDDDITHKYRNGTNYFTIHVDRSRQRSLYMVMAGLVFGIIFGLALKFLVSEEISFWIKTNILDSISTIFLNAIKMLVGPLIFFSIVSCISNFNDLSALGKTGLKLFGMYLLTGALAIACSYFMTDFLHPGSPALAGAVSADGSAVVQNAIQTTVSIRDTIINIVPSNFAKAFVENDMLQLIVIGLVLGIAIGKMGRGSSTIKQAFDALNELFSKATAVVIGFLPLSVFCSMASMMINMEPAALISLLGYVGTEYLTFIVMMVLYALLVLILGHTNPVTFIRKYAPTLAVAFSLSSGSAAIPVCMKACDEKLKISPAMYSFSIPFGSTINTDGSCIAMIVAVMFLARVFGVSIGASVLPTFFFAVFMLGLGAPSVPGSGLICIAMLLPQVGVPVEAVSLIMGVHPLLSAIKTASNCMGDAAITMIVAKSEKMMEEIN